MVSDAAPKSLFIAAGINKLFGAVCLTLIIYVSS